MTTLVLQPHYTEDSVKLWKAACNRGWKVQRLRYNDEGWYPPVCLDEPLVFYGWDWESRLLAEGLGYQLTEPAEDWLVHLPKDLTGRGIEHTTLGVVRSDWLPGRHFVKCAGDRCFPSKVYLSADELPDDLKSDLPVLVQEPVDWDTEYRCFVLDGKIVTNSRYRWTCSETPDEMDMRLNERYGELSKAQALIDAAPGLPNACVVDVGVIAGAYSDHGYRSYTWAIVEANAPWCSGLYQCDPDRALDVIAACCVKHAPDA